MLPVSPVAGGAFPINDTGGQRGRQDPLSTSLLSPILPAQPYHRPSTPGSPLYPHTTALHLRCRDRDSDRGRGVTTATMPGETSDGGGEDINGGQGRHIESLSLIFAQRRCEFFLLARKVAAQGWCLGFAYRHERFRGYCWHASSPVHLIRLSSSLSLCIRTYFVFVFVTTRSWFSHSLEEAARDMVKTMRGYARRKRFTKTCGNRACMIARR